MWAAQASRDRGAERARCSRRPGLPRHEAPALAPV